MNRHLKSDLSLGTCTANIGTLLIENGLEFADRPAFGHRLNDQFEYISWRELLNDIYSFAAYLKAQGLNKTDKIAIVSSNSYQRLVTELSVMSMGMVSVPIYPGYPASKIERLLLFSDVCMLIMEDSDKLFDLDRGAIPARILNFKDITDILERGELSTSLVEIQEQMRSVAPDDLNLLMYTSGTTSFPKGVLLTHRNILSQQRAIDILWKLEKGLRFLCYLPWHHSFGGLFERFLALSNGGCLCLDDSVGKDIDRLISNFSVVRPHIYFSVPQVYQQIISQVMLSQETKKIFFHSDLKFVFTAAAPLPISTSDVFKENRVPVVEGWGLTETSPCCTLTEQSLERTAGVVGFPIPDVEIKLSDDNELLVKGPNIMQGYYKLPEETQKVLPSSGWFHTGDVGEITDEGVKIVSRMDRIFKLANAEKVFPVAIEENVRKRCHFIRFIYVIGSGEKYPLALVFPNFELLNSKKEGLKVPNCVGPTSLPIFKDCLMNCLCDLNANIPVKFERIKRAVMINRELSIDQGELTPSMKLVPRIIEKNFAQYITCLKSGKTDVLPKDALMVEIN